MAAFTARRWLGALVIVSVGLAAQIPAPDGAVIALAPLTATERGWVADPDTIPSPARLGFGRVISEDAWQAALGDPAHWQTLADGSRRLTLSIRSPGARGLRLGLAVDALPDRATVIASWIVRCCIGLDIILPQHLDKSADRDQTQRILCFPQSEFVPDPTLF